MWTLFRNVDQFYAEVSDWECSKGHRGADQRLVWVGIGLRCQENLGPNRVLDSLGSGRKSLVNICNRHLGRCVKTKSLNATCTRDLKRQNQENDTAKRPQKALSKCQSKRMSGRLPIFSRLGMDQCSIYAYAVLCRCHVSLSSRLVVRLSGGHCHAIVPSRSSGQKSDVGHWGGWRNA